MVYFVKLLVWLVVSSGSKNCCSCGRNLFTKFWEKGLVVGGKGGGGGGRLLGTG